MGINIQLRPLQAYHLAESLRLASIAKRSTLINPIVFSHDMSTWEPVIEKIYDFNAAPAPLQASNRRSTSGSSSCVC